MLFLSCVCYAFGVRLFIDALWSPAMMSNCEFILTHWYLGSGAVLDCIDS